MKNLLFLFIILLSLSCKNNNQNNISQKPTVTVSILPQKYFVNRIAGEAIDVNVMIPEGSDPHIYEPTAEQMRELSNSDAYFRIGYVDFELAWIYKFEALNSAMKIVDLSQDANLISSEENHNEHSDSHFHGIDPHIWSSPSEAKKICKILFNSLIELYPQNKIEFEKNYLAFLEEITNIDLYISEKLRGFEGKKFMIYHPALTYFARDYKLVQISVENDGKEPTPQELKMIIDEAREENIRVIFVQKQFNKHNAEVLANEINGKVVEIDPLGYNWEETVRLIADEISKSYSEK